MRALWDLLERQVADFSRIAAATGLHVDAA